MITVARRDPRSRWEVDYNGHAFPVGSRRADLAGQYLCSEEHPYRAWIHSVIGDMEFFSQHLGTPAPASEELCWLCSANRDATDRPWNCFHKDRWPNHWMTTPRRRPYPFDHPLFEVFGVTGQSLALDTMHVVDLGTTSHVLGNAIYEIVYEQSGGMSAKRATANLWEEMQKQYKDLNIPHRATFQCWRNARPNKRVKVTIVEPLRASPTSLDNLSQLFPPTRSKTNIQKKKKATRNIITKKRESLSRASNGLATLGERKVRLENVPSQCEKPSCRLPVHEQILESSPTEVAGPSHGEDLRRKVYRRDGGPTDAPLGVEKLS